MQHVSYETETQRYGKCIEVSKRIRWDIDEDVIRGRRFDFSQKFLPDGLSLVDRLDFLLPHEQRLLSQIQGRSYANIFGLVERFINAKVLEVSRDHWFGDQTALEALIRFSDEEPKHQELFRRIEKLIGEEMPEGYVFVPDPNQVNTELVFDQTYLQGSAVGSSNRSYQSMLVQAPGTGPFESLKVDRQRNQMSL